MEIVERLVRNTGFIFFSEVINKLISLFFIAYAARVLGAGNFGFYALIGTVASLFFYFGNFGISPMAVRELARDRTKADELFNHILSLRVSLIVLAYPLLIFVVNFLGYRNDIKYLIYIAGFSMIFSTFSNSFRILYVAFERFITPSLISILVTFLGTISNILVLYLGYGLKGIVLVSFFGNILGTVISGFWVRKRFLKYRFVFNLSIWKDLMFKSMPFGIIQFVNQANAHMNILFLSKLPGPISGEVAMGYYNSSSSVCQKALILPQSFNQAALPTVSSNVEDRKMVKSIIDISTKSFIAVVIFPLILATTIFPKEIIAILFGKEFLPSAPALTIFGWAYALRVFNMPVSITLSASREVKRFIPWAFLEFCINLILAVPLIIFYSFLGAAIAFLFSNVFETILRNFLLRTIWGIKGLKIKEFLNVFSPIAITVIVVLLAKISSVGPERLFILSMVLYITCVLSFKDYREGVFTLINGLRGKRKALTVE